MIRDTHQKRAVCQAVRELIGTHPSADDVYVRVKSQLPSISRATVYRILNTLADNKSVTRVCFPQSADRFDAATRSHGHICCEKCGKVFDTEDCILPKVALPDSREGRVTGYNVVFTGVCNDCNAKL